MEKFNIVKPKKYTRDGVEKTNWAIVGSLIKLDGDKMFMELNHLDGTFQIFKQEKKEAPQAPKTEAQLIEEIPF